jgi:hypothetical protein
MHRIGSAFSHAGLLLDLGFDHFPRLEQPPELVAQGLLGPHDLVSFPALSGFSGDEHVPQPIGIAVELAASFAFLAGRRLFPGGWAELGSVLEAGAAESLMFVHIARQLASSTTARTFRC